MTKDELKGACISFTERCVIAHIKGVEALQAVDQFAQDYASAAVDALEAFEDVPDEDMLTPEEQYDCFIEACKRAGVDPENPILAAEREAFDKPSQEDLQRALSKAL